MKLTLKKNMLIYIYITLSRRRRISINCRTGGEHDFYLCNAPITPLWAPRKKTLSLAIGLKTSFLLGKWAELSEKYRSYGRQMPLARRTNARTGWTPKQKSPILGWNPGRESEPKLKFELQNRENHFLSPKQCQKKKLVGIEKKIEIENFLVENFFLVTENFLDRFFFGSKKNWVEKKSSKKSPMVNML